MATPIYRSTPIKRGRRTSQEIEELKAALYDIVETYRPVTVRQVFYQMTSRGHIAKKETEYKNVVVRLLGEMRKAGSIPYNWISDETRWMRKPTTWSTMDEMLEDAAISYRRALWNNQDSYVEVWLEKEALAGVLVDVTAEWDVPLMVTKGFPSLTFLHSAGESISYETRPSYLYYFGDHDPSGLDITRNVEESIREFAPEVELHFERIAVNRQQIDEWDLPTRPTKKTDSRSKSFKGESVEVDSIEPTKLRSLARNAIVQHIDYDALEKMRAVEREERRTLEMVTDRIAGISSVENDSRLEEIDDE